MFLNFYIGVLKMSDKLNKAVLSIIPAVDAFDAVIAEQADAIYNVASLTADLYRVDGELKNTGVQVADMLADVLGSQGVLTYGWFQAVQFAVADAYRIVKPGVSDDAVRKAWSRAFACVTDNYNIEKPKAENKEAEKKAVQRAKEVELLAAYESLDVVELKDKVKDLYNKAGDGDKKAKKEADLIVKAIDIRSKAENEEFKAERKELKSQIAGALKKVEDISVLQEVLYSLLGSVDDNESLL